jgi:hypothetical protein
MKSSTASRLMCPPATWTCAGVSSSADHTCARTRIVPSSFFHDKDTAVASPEKEASTPTKTSARSGISSSERQAAQRAGVIQTSSAYVHWFRCRRRKADRSFPASFVAGVGRAGRPSSPVPSLDEVGGEEVRDRRAVASVQDRARLPSLMQLRLLSEGDGDEALLVGRGRAPVCRLQPRKLRIVDERAEEKAGVAIGAEAAVA